MSFDADPAAVWARHGHARKTLATVTQGLSREGVDVLAVKGVITSDWLYGDASERPFVDVDIRIRPRDFGAALRAAEREGWRVGRRIRAYRSLVLEVDGLPIDVESYVGPRGVCALSVDRVLQRATRAVDGYWLPEIHDHAVLLTVNVFKDKMTAATDWAVEDARRVVTAPGVDLDVFVERVIEARLEAVTWLVADWMAERLASDAWRVVRAKLGPAPPRRYYGALVRWLWARNAPFSTPLRVVSRAASDDPTRQLRALAWAGAWELEARWGPRHRGHR